MIDDSAATEQLWVRLHRPFDAVEAFDALLGLTHDVVAQLAGTRVATGPAVDRLLGRMPVIARALSTTVRSRPERCYGEIRGPILWSETTAARGASAGAPDLFVCSVPRRDHDTDENRVLVAALGTIRTAARDVDLLPSDAYDDDLLRQARANGQRAARWMMSGPLAKVPRVRPTGREMRRTRSGTRKATYHPAVDVLERAQTALTAADAVAFCDRRTRAQHHVLLGVLERIEATTGRRRPLLARDGSLRSGLVEFHHPRQRGDRSRLHGILVGDVLVDVPDRLADHRRELVEASLTDRADGRRVVAVLEEVDIDRAVELALSGR
ncbi:MAG TPA: hypothetical protein VK866_04520 [Acidimicrobiales bacterium]|nr:hypothetical protein [Acidimicrobiales bacterium]